MNLLIVAGVCGLIIPVYFLLLMTDGRKLRRRLWEQRIGSLRETPEGSSPLIEQAFPKWTAPRFCRAELEGGGDGFELPAPCWENSPPD